MRVASIVLAAGAAILAWSAGAQPAGGGATDSYLAELAQQCPDRRLEMLAPAQLRDGLDDFISTLPQTEQDQVRQAERAQCSSMEAGATCVNVADIGAVDQLGQTSALATSICDAYLRCRAQSDCDSAR